MNNRENRGVKKDGVYEEFILWTSMPPSERHRLGIETQQQFSEYYGISINTPTAWKKRSDFQSRVTALRKEWAFEKTSFVIESILRSAVQGNSASQKLWLQYFHNFPKEQEVEKPRLLLHPNDIRFLVLNLPEPEQTEGLFHLRDIVDLLAKVKNENRELKEMHELEHPTDPEETLLEFKERWDREGKTKEAFSIPNSENIFYDSCDPHLRFRTDQTMTSVVAVWVPHRGVLPSTTTAGV
ncbi:MAG TPA: hypothetical protein VHC68_01130 [Candidatus Paceibacterota bacterium]|nr:hypothetical protein [Candidatus Paceibacterota bacterium]